MGCDSDADRRRDGAVVDEARNEVIAGRPIASTALGHLLAHIARQGAFALFWAADYETLPAASDLAELWQIIDPQIRQSSANWELYVRFEPRAVV